MLQCAHALSARRALRLRRRHHAASANSRAAWRGNPPSTTTVVFGTSGWREAIGEGFTVENVHKVVRGIIAMMKTAEFLKTNGYAGFDRGPQAAGVLVLRDNRFMGDEFMAAAMRELAAEGIAIHDAGECPTGVGSAILTEFKAAGSINFTPSHNPMEYAGIKFNPADGGPADVNLTSLIEAHANAFMRASRERFRPPFVRAAADFRPLRTMVDAAAMFTEFVEKKSKVFDLKALRAWLRANAKDLFIAVDNMHGSSRGYIQSLLGPDTMGALEAAEAIRFYNTEDDYSFHGVKPEPNAAQSGHPHRGAEEVRPQAHPGRGPGSGCRSHPLSRTRAWIST